MATTEPDTEITLGTGRMLGLFFALVVICGVFFAVGFSLGKKSGTPAQDKASAVPQTVATAGGRPGASKTTTPGASSDFGFYKAVEQKTADSQLAPQDTSGQPTPQSVAQTAPAGTQAPSAAPTPDAGKTPEAAPAGNSYYVQVAAVSRQEDAEALVEALKKKEYPAFTSNNSPTDKFYHVQVGPFAELKDADDMRKRLVGDGYNPIVKK